jgi:hypothetical protein
MLLMVCMSSLLQRISFLRRLVRIGAGVASQSDTLIGTPCLRDH